MKFQCKSKLKEKNRIWTRNYTLAKEENKETITADEEEFFYTTIIQYDKSEEKTIVHMLGKGICPTIKFSKMVFQFGECPLNQRRDILFTVENKNSNLPLSIFFHKVNKFNNFQ